MAEKRVCESNRKAVEWLYAMLLLEIEGQETSFDQFLIENFDKVHPSGGVFSYADGQVKCSEHPDDGVPEDQPGGEVPWL